MLSHGIYSVILLIFSNVFMTFAWYGHLKNATRVQLVCSPSVDWCDCI